ncbi:acyl carrier protein [Streptomyces sp. NBC_01190]|uniref:acyl carrier protein n=1 Tax=Streptomyces sp. NBC_01190 TaxID=2903767 RepID=UPI003869B7C7|nr:acyl carrier protein [Streptomyces sp. NBC_01190]
MSRQLELDELTTLLRECAGEDESADLASGVLDVPFTVLGYDSLAILQTTGRIERDYQVMLDEKAVFDVATPREYLALVNDALAGQPEVS